MLRPLTRADLVLLGEWLREPLVHEWWHDDPDPDALERQYSAIGSAPVVVPAQADDATSIGVLHRAGFVVAATAEFEPDDPAHARTHLVRVREERA